MISCENLRDFLMRVEELQLNLTEIAENVGDQMLCSVVLKGVPNNVASFIYLRRSETRSFEVR